MHYIAILLLGLFVGSFANVCIYRWPRSGSILFPRRSYCPWCESTIRWYDNIPILSYLNLKGKCRRCRARISIQYPAIEISLAVLWLFGFVLMRRFNAHSSLLWIGALFFLYFALLVSSMTDLEWKIIPDAMTYPLMAVGVLLSPWNIFFNSTGAGNIASAMTGIIAGGGGLFVVAAIGRFIFKKEAMGGGDIKLLAGIGAILGWKGAIATLFIGSAIGAVASLVAIATGLLKRHQYIPFGPFLSFGAWISSTVMIIEPAVFNNFFD